MTTLDILLGALLLWGAYRGFKNGLLIELAALAALVAGVYGAIHFSDLTGEQLAQWTHWEQGTVHVAAFVLTFVLIVIGVHLAGKVLTKLVQAILLGLPNRIFGALFGALKVAVVLGMTMVYFTRVTDDLGVLPESSKQESALYGPIYHVGTVVHHYIFAGRA
ncbi:CvpA family protein [Maribacter sp. 2307ULW6-5]|uniref:CvpA family protein n=1 Tax=Maribacter sp. 2307ULW6-5 TaxID=3386275 RepID=UPI0039BD155B